MIQSVAFVVYAVTDPEQSRAFYEGALGLTLSRRWENEWIEYDIGDTSLAIARADKDNPAGGKRPALAFEVSDLDVFVAGLKTKGVTLAQDIFDTPVCRMAVVHDPDGNEIILHKLKAVA
jgi:predicted enzyme related to lactoylglutathione lyase